jgi:hypothetical protein
MTLHIHGIAVEEADNQQPECKANSVDQFWLAASDVASARHSTHHRCRT